MAERRKLEEELDSLKEQKGIAVSKEEFQEAQRLKNRQEEIELRLRSLEKPVQSCPTESTKGADEEKLRLLRARVEEAVAAERFDEASELKAKEREVLGWSKGTEEAWVTETDIAQVVAGWTGIAVEQVSATESARLMKLEQELAKSVVGQSEAVSSASRALRRARAGLRNPSRPIAALMFCGPTGVGKTALCKTLASCFFGSEDSMIRLDMSEFMEKHTVSKLIGAPPGLLSEQCFFFFFNFLWALCFPLPFLHRIFATFRYVGYGEGGTLTESVRRRPYSLVLFDEVEKAPLHGRWQKRV